MAPEHSDQWQTCFVCVVEARTESGEFIETQECWFLAGVPDYNRGTAKHAASNEGYYDVWPFAGTSWDEWCGFKRPENDIDAYRMCDQITEACRADCLKAHRSRMQEEAR